MKRTKILPKTLENQSLLENYKSYISVVGYGEQNVKNKLANGAEFLGWLERLKISSVDEVTTPTIKEYCEYLKNRPHRCQEGVRSLKTVASNIHSIKIFFAWLQESGVIITNPMSVLRFKLPKSKPTPRTILTIEEAKELYKTTETFQERAILSLAYGCGLRNKEIMQANINDIRVNEGILIVPRGKGNKRRVIPMSRQVEQDIRNYINNERYLYLKNKEEQAFILNIKGDRMGKYSVLGILKRIIARTDNQNMIEKNIGIHSLRHSIATHLLEQGLPVEQVRNFLGHTHLETTEIYTRVSQEQLKALIS